MKDGSATTMLAPDESLCGGTTTLRSASCVAIVDPYNAGSLLAEQLRSRGARCIALITHPHPAWRFRKSLRPELFDAVIEHDGDMDVTVARTARQQPQFIIAGFTSGTELADVLSERLQLPTNGTALSEARNHKFLMQETLRAAGLRSARQFCSANLDELLAWIETELKWPVVVKPVRSLASDHVCLCNSPDEVCTAVRGILQHPNQLGRINASVVAQEYLDGVEYVVDTVSYQGRHKVTAFWRYDRPRRQILYDAMTLLDYDGPEQEVLGRYWFAVLDALGLRFGPAHGEIMLLNDGPVLVEINPRLTAPINTVLSAICGGPCQMDDTVLSILAPDRFLASFGEPRHLQRQGANVFIMPPRAGRLVALHGVEELEKLPSMYRLSLSSSAEPGKPVPQCAGVATLVAENLADLSRDIAAIRRLERDMLFEVE